MPSRISWPAGVCIQLVGRENPERRDRGADGDDHRRQHMQPARHAVAAEQQDAEEASLRGRTRSAPRSRQRPDDVAGDDARSGSSWCRTGRTARCRTRRPCRTTPRKSWSRTARSAGSGRGRSQPRSHMQRGDIGRQPDGEAREDDVERDGEGELQSRQQDGIEIHRSVPSSVRDRTRRTHHVGLLLNSARGGCCLRHAAAMLRSLSG